MGSKQRCKNPFWKRRKLRKRQKKRERNHDGTYKRPEVTGGQIIPPALVENQTAEYGPDSSSESAAQDENNNDISGLQGTALPRQKSSSQTAEHGRMRAAVPRQQLSSQTVEHGSSIISSKIRTYYKSNKENFSSKGFRNLAQCTKED